FYRLTDTAWRTENFGKDLQAPSARQCDSQTPDDLRNSGWNQYAADSCAKSCPKSQRPTFINRANIFRRALTKQDHHHRTVEGDEQNLRERHNPKPKKK